MSQKFRNLRRNSQPVPAHCESKQKIVTAQHAVPVATGRPSSAEGDDDHVAYERNIQSLSEELAKANPNSNRVYQLLKLTHSTRRSNIEHCDLRASELKEEYPFFGLKKKGKHTACPRKCNYTFCHHGVMVKFEYLYDYCYLGSDGI